jgi:hypothetical protein
MSTIFESSTKEQKANKPKIKDACDYFLGDSLKKSVLCLIDLFTEFNIKINWYGKNSYRCTYKGKRILLCNFNNKNDIRIGVSLADAHKKDELEKILHELPNNLRKEYVTNKNKHCGRCMGSACDFNLDFVEAGETHPLCVHNAGYILHNPTPTQFKRIEDFVRLRVGYIDAERLRSRD